MLKNTSAFSHCPVLQHWNLRFSSCLFKTSPLLLVWTLTFLTLKILPAQEHLQTQKSTTGLLSTNTKNTQYWNLALNALQDFCLLLDGIKMWPAGLFYILLCVTFAFFVQLQWRLSRKRFIFHFMYTYIFLFKNMTLVFARFCISASVEKIQRTPGMTKDSDWTSSSTLFIFVISLKFLFSQQHWHMWAMSVFGFHC